jgi:N-ethylmaleimide reductase
MKLLEAFQLNSLLTLSNRIMMAPMTRNMADDDLVPTKTMAEYYARRATCGLIITEGTIIRPDGRGYSNTPGIYTQAQVDGWSRVCEKVHQRGGKIFCQIWHVGRVSHPHFLNGQLPVGPSATTMKERIRRTKDLYYAKNRALLHDELSGLYESFANAAENARNAGFDGVEIHAANGYLIDQFLHYSTNKRQDEYGGDPENMARFALGVVKACGKSIGFERVGIRLSPAAYLNEIIEDQRDAEVFEVLLTRLNDFPIAYVHTGNFDDSLKFDSLGKHSMTKFMRSHFLGILVACGSYSIERAEQGVADNEFDCVAIGRRFIANPDLIEKIKAKKKLTSYEVSMLERLE